MKVSALLSLLDDQKVHSGESLAKALGVSRTAVWKQIRKALDDGVEIRTIKGRGYQLMSAVDLLDPDAINRDLPQALKSRIDLSVLSEVTSTNREVASRLPTCDSASPVVLADSQSAGRGRMGRPWASPKAENLYLSLGLTLTGGFAALEGLSLVLGLAVANALEGLGAVPVGLKWPNDLYASGQKVGGILVEIQGELQEGKVQVIAGIGINVHMSQSEVVDQPWTSLALAWPEQKWNRGKIATAILVEIDRAMEKFEANGFPWFAKQWQERDIFYDKPLVANDGALFGVGAGIDSKGNYLVTQGDETNAVRAGDIRLRVQA
ncbi:MAG: biotin--[acetyl-CoA-carboxylase] ligase [Marinobacter sp.]|nr:biotin--[acetyl-CoA-carboxylase] ligase [Marinobacter sp.]